MWERIAKIYLIALTKSFEIDKISTRVIFSSFIFVQGKILEKKRHACQVALQILLHWSNKVQAREMSKKKYSSTCSLNTPLPRTFVMVCLLQPVWNIPKFEDRANWSRNTFQPMRRQPMVKPHTFHILISLPSTF